MPWRHDRACRPRRGNSRSAKFLSPVQPGESLTLHYAESPAGGFRFEIRCIAWRERGVASGAVVFMQAAEA